jgi:hypothetical protein
VLRLCQTTGQPNAKNSRQASQRRSVTMSDLRAALMFPVFSMALEIQLISTMAITCP